MYSNRDPPRRADAKLNTPWRPIRRGGQALRLCVNLIFLSWEINEAHWVKNQIEKWFKKYTFKKTKKYMLP